MKFLWVSFGGYVCDVLIKIAAEVVKNIFNAANPDAKDSNLEKSFN